MSEPDAVVEKMAEMLREVNASGLQLDNELRTQICEFLAEWDGDEQETDDRIAAENWMDLV